MDESYVRQLAERDLNRITRRMFQLRSEPLRVGTWAEYPTVMPRASAFAGTKAKAAKSAVDARAKRFIEKSNPREEYDFSTCHRSHVSTFDD